MISDRDLVFAALATYDPNGNPFFQGADGALRAFLTTINDTNVVSIQGTHNAIDWAIDFVAIPEETRPNGEFGGIGFVHLGFLALIVDLAPAVRLIAKRGPYVLNGHSLGAAVAIGLGALMTFQKLPPQQIGAFAPPRVGGDELLAALKGIPISAYRYADDPVPCVPFTLPGIPYRQVPLIQIGRASFATAILDPFKYHHVSNYVADLTGGKDAG